MNFLDGRMRLCLLASLAQVTSWRSEQASQEPLAPWEPVGRIRRSTFAAFPHCLPQESVLSFCNPITLEFVMPKTTLNPILTVSALALAFWSAAATAQEVPNLIGNWTGTIVGGARFGALNHDPEQKEPVFADQAKVWTLSIVQQEGSGMIGTWSTETKTEQLVGVIRLDNVSVIFADEDNTFDARLLSENEMELCAQEAEEATIAVCYLMKRK